MKIIVISSKCFCACNKVSSLDNLVILQKEAILDLWSVQGGFQRNQRQKLGILRRERKGEIKHE